MQKLCGIPATNEQVQFLCDDHSWYHADEEGRPSHIWRKFKFKDYDQAMLFLNRIHSLARELDHHPDFNLFKYRNIEIELTSHSLGGVSQADIQMALAISTLYTEFGGAVSQA